MAAKRIISIRTRRLKGAEEVTHLGEANRAGVRWLSARDVIRSIEDGEHFYVEAGGESLLLSVQKGSDGKKKLAVGFEQGSELLLGLPRDAS